MSKRIYKSGYQKRKQKKLKLCEGVTIDRFFHNASTIANSSAQPQDTDTDVPSNCQSESDTDDYDYDKNENYAKRLANKEDEDNKNSGVAEESLMDMNMIENKRMQGQGVANEDDNGNVNEKMVSLS
jgi:hypothetical protein